MRLCYLAFERPPHPDAVVVAITSDEARLVLEQLAASTAVRHERAAKLRRCHAQQQRLPPHQRPGIPCRRDAGLYVLLPWRLAQWLACVLPGPESLLDRTRQQLEQWLGRQTVSRGLGDAHSTPAARLTGTIVNPTL